MGQAERDSEVGVDVLGFAVRLQEETLLLPAIDPNGSMQLELAGLGLQQSCTQLCSSSRPVVCSGSHQAERS